MSAKRMTTINVLKAFRFTTPADREHGVPMPIERVFTVGEHEIDAATARHPWIAAPNYADGCIETPKGAAQRRIARQEKEQLDASTVLHATEAAEQAIARMRRNQPKRADQVQATEEELNTPVGILRARQQTQAVSAPD
jgi:hypothetical protein